MKNIENPYKTAPRLSHFNADLAKEVIRKRAAAEFEMPSELMRQEGCIARIANHPLCLVKLVNKL